MTHAAKTATNQYRRDARFQYKNRKSVLVILSEQNILIGTKRIELDKNYFSKTKFFTADQFNMEVDKPQPKNNPRTITLSQIGGKNNLAKIIRKIVDQIDIKFTKNYS